MGAGDVDDRMVANFVRGVGDGANRIQLRGGIDITLVTAGDVVVDFDAGDVAPWRGYDFASVFAFESVGANAHVVGPVLRMLIGGGGEGGGEEEESECDLWFQFGPRISLLSLENTGAKALRYSRLTRP